MQGHSDELSSSTPAQPGLPETVTGVTKTSGGSNTVFLPDWVTEIYSVNNQAIQKISQADSIEQALRIASGALERSPFVTLQFGVERGALVARGMLQPEEMKQGNALPETLPELTLSLTRIERLLEGTAPLTVRMDEQATLPSDLASLLCSLEVRAAALIPIWRAGSLFGLYVLGTRDEAELNPLTIQPYVSLASQVSTTSDKVLAMGHLHRRVAGLQSLASISQAISVISDLSELFGLIHEKISQVMGEVDMAIALYDPETDTVSIPYAFEAGEEISLPPFPLGQGLTSILIHTQQPLMLVEDTERRALELGAKISGAAAKSWLGVPLVVANEVLGAIIVQDAQNEHRFDLDDLRLMTTLAAQVAITLRNIRLYQTTKERAERERMLTEINSRIWSSADIESIARTALVELGRGLRASAGSIEISGKYIESSTQTPYEHADRTG